MELLLKKNPLTSRTTSFITESGRLLIFSLLHLFKMTPFLLSKLRTKLRAK